MDLELYSFFLSSNRGQKAFEEVRGQRAFEEVHEHRAFEEVHGQRAFEEVTRNDPSVTAQS